MYDFLKKIPLFAGLPKEDLERLCEMVEEVHLPAGQTLFYEGDLGSLAYVVKEGQIEIVKSSAGKEVELALLDSGQVMGEMAVLNAAPRIATARARTDCILIAISQDVFEKLLNTSPSAARCILETVTSRLRNTEILLRQSEKMAQLGTLTAGMAHELNNPAAAALRGAEQLRSAIAGLVEDQMQIGQLNLDQARLDMLTELESDLRLNAAQPDTLDPIERSDRESDIQDWLDAHGIENGWELTPSLVGNDLTPQALDKLAEEFSVQSIHPILSWLANSYTIHSLLQEIIQGARQISDIVKAMKTYVYLDQGPVQSIDLHEGIENTLVILRSKLRKGVTIHREFSPDIPPIQAYGSELNQVWTNLIDNAIDAMDGIGTITIRTRLAGDNVVLEFEDSGPGIPTGIQENIFNPFFTTKPVGKGTGLGLNTSYNIIRKHGGDIHFDSHPGKTIFYITLPIELKSTSTIQKKGSNELTASDEELKHIYETTRTIAVVGISSREETPAFTVPAYLQKQGYRIIPINPKLDHILDEKAYPDLISNPNEVDVVLIFRRGEDVPPIVDQAIQIKAKVIWMQEGIVNEEAAQTARKAGLEVVMNTCMRAQHKRLYRQAP